MNECELMKNIWQLQPMSFMGYCVNIHIIQHEESDKNDYTQVCSQKKMFILGNIRKCRKGNVMI